MEDTVRQSDGEGQNLLTKALGLIRWLFIPILVHGAVQVIDNVCGDVGQKYNFRMRGQ